MYPVTSVDALELTNATRVFGAVCAKILAPQKLPTNEVLTGDSSEMDGLTDVEIATLGVALAPTQKGLYDGWMTTAEAARYREKNPRFFKAMVERWVKRLGFPEYGDVVERLQHPTYVEEVRTVPGVPGIEVSDCNRKRHLQSTSNDANLHTPPSPTASGYYSVAVRNSNNASGPRHYQFHGLVAAAW